MVLLHPGALRTHARLQVNMPMQNSAGAWASRSLAVAGLVVMLDYAAEFLIPLAFAALLALTLTPLVRGGRRIGLPRPVGAFIVVALCVTGIFFALDMLWAPASELMNSAPQMLRDLGPKLRALSAPIAELQNAGSNLATATEISQAMGAESEVEPVTVKVETESFLEVAASASLKTGSGILATVFLLFFLLAYGDGLLDKAHRLRAWAGEEQMPLTEMAVAAQSRISRYLLLISLVNGCLGLVVAGALHLLDFPNPVLWGIGAALLNFVPYVGAAIMAILLLLASLVTFEPLGLALMVPVGFLVLTTLEGQLVTPMLLGTRLAISPYIAFIAITFWGWLWGFVGVLLAVPLLVITKIVADHVPRLEWLSIAIGRSARLRGESDVRTVPAGNATTD